MRRFPMKGQPDGLLMRPATKAQKPAEPARHLLEKAVLERREDPQPRAPALIDELHSAVVPHLLDMQTIP